MLWILCCVISSPWRRSIFPPSPTPRTHPASGCWHGIWIPFGPDWGEEFMDKLWEVLAEQGRADQEAAFLRGLRLGLALHRL